MIKSFLPLYIILTFIGFTFGKDIKNVYCIQILSTKNLEEAKKHYKKVENLPYTRIEKINGYFVIRVGNKKSTHLLKPLLRNLKKDYPDAFLRVCDILEKRTIASNFVKKEEPIKKQIIKSKIKHFDNITTELSKKEKKIPKEMSEKLTKKKRKIHQKDILSLIPDIKFDLKKSKKKLKLEKKESLTSIKATPYVDLSINIVKLDKYKLKETLKKYRNFLPYKDKLQAQILIGNINTALKTSYENLEKNSDDFIAYNQLKDLYTNYSNQIFFKSIYEHIGDLSRFNILSRIKLYAGKNVYMSFYENSYFTTSYQKKDYKYLPTLDTVFYLQLSKLFDDKKLSLKFGYRKSLTSIPIFKIKYTQNMNKYWQSYWSLNIHEYSQDSNYAFYSAFKNSIEYNSTITFNSKNIINSYISAEKYYTQDYKFLANGLNIYTTYSHKYRLGYPDISTYTYFSYGNYKEKYIKKGKILDILPTNDTRVLPNNFAELGVGVSFGNDYTESYKKQVRPFLDSNIVYNTVYKFGYSLFVGLGGQMFYSDNLAIGIQIGKGVSGNAYDVFRLQLFYKKWF